MATPELVTPEELAKVHAAWVAEGRSEAAKQLRRMARVVASPLPGVRYVIRIPVRLWRNGVLLDPGEYETATEEELDKVCAEKLTAQLLARLKSGNSSNGSTA